MKRKTKNILMILLIVLMCGSMFLTMYYAKTNSMPSDNFIHYDGELPPDIPNGENFSNNDNTIQKPSDEALSNDMSDNEKNIPQEMNKKDFNNNSISVIYYLIFGVESLILSCLLIYLIISKFNIKSFKETYNDSKNIIISVLVIIVLTGGITYLDTVIMKTYFLNSNKEVDNKPSGNNSETITYKSNKEITTEENITEETFTSSTSDENTILVNGDIDVVLDGVTATKSGDSDGGDNTSFYGINSAILAKSGANLIIKNATITTDAVGANGVFSYGGSATTSNSSSDGTTITISDSTITTAKDNSGGIMTTGGGVTNATNLIIKTSGISSAAIRTDRGGGTVSVDGGTYTTTAQGSPTIYSTANVTVNNASLVSEASEGIVIEGKNKVSITNCNLTDSNTKLNGQSTTYKNIFLYQSMSGDAESGVSEFDSTGSTITTNNGDSFYVTNTSAIINLENNTIINNDSTGNFLRVQKDSWGTSGSNGGNVTLNITNQKANGNVVIDSISTLTMSMKNASYYEGAINTDNTAKSISLTLDKTSKLKLTANSYITSFENEDATNSNIDFNNYKLYVNGESIN